MIGQQFVQCVAMVTAKVGHGVVIDLHATTDPPVRIMRLCQPGDPTGIANAFQWQRRFIGEQGWGRGHEQGVANEMTSSLYRARHAGGQTWGNILTASEPLFDTVAA